MKYKLNDNIFLYTNEESYLVDLETNDSFKLNQLSYLICVYLENTFISLEDLVDLLYQDYKSIVAKAVLKKDVREFIGDLVDKGIIVAKENK